MPRAVLLLTVAALLAACGNEESEEQAAPVAQAEPDLASPPALSSAGPERVEGDEPVLPEGETIGTPLEERVATLGLLNKRNNESRDIELQPGESRRVGDIIVRLASCERTRPWEMPRETGAFVQVLVPADEDRWRKIFSGWLFKNAPGVNVVEHPIYDVWVKDCAMSFPGEEESAESSENDRGTE